MTDCFQGNYLGDISFPAPFLLDEADYMTDYNLFGTALWFNSCFLEKELLMHLYVMSYWLSGGVTVEIILTWC